MGSYQGLITRKLLPDIGQAMTMASGSSSPPPPLRSSPEMKPITAMIAFVVAVFFLVAFLSIQFRRWYTYGGRSGHVRTVSYNLSEPTQGLDVSILETLPKIIFSASVQTQKKEKKKQVTECAICLEEFEDQETLRLLPQCGHAFHLECINMWFFSHMTCPLCRHSLLHPNAIAMAVAVAAASPNDVSIAANSVPTEALQIRVPESPSEEGESSEGSRCAELRRSHSMGHSILKAGLKFPASSSSPPLRLLIVHRSRSYTVLSDLWRSSEGT